MFDVLHRIQTTAGVTEFECRMDIEVGPLGGRMDRPEEAYQFFEILVVRHGQLYKTRIVQSDAMQLVSLRYGGLLWHHRCKMAAEEMLDMLYGR